MTLMVPRMKRVTSALVVCLLLSAATAAHADPADDYIASQMRAFHLPGLALAVVKDGKVIKAQGYGLANVARKTPVTLDSPGAKWEYSMSATTRWRRPFTKSPARPGTST
jgi:CubicO group peptidase (beta-lactamase class C family)